MHTTSSNDLCGIFSKNLSSISLSSGRYPSSYSFWLNQNNNQNRNNNFSSFHYPQFQNNTNRNYVSMSNSNYGSVKRCCSFQSNCTNNNSYDKPIFHTTSRLISEINNGRRQQVFNYRNNGLNDIAFNGNSSRHKYYPSFVNNNEMPSSRIFQENLNSNSSCRCDPSIRKHTNSTCHKLIGCVSKPTVRGPMTGQFCHCSQVQQNLTSCRTSQPRVSIKECSHSFPYKIPSNQSFVKNQCQNDSRLHFRKSYCCNPFQKPVNHSSNRISKCQGIIGNNRLGAQSTLEQSYCRFVPKNSIQKSVGAPNGMQNMTSSCLSPCVQLQPFCSIQEVPNSSKAGNSFKRRFQCQRLTPCLPKIPECQINTEYGVSSLNGNPTVVPQCEGAVEVRNIAPETFSMQQNSCGSFQKLTRCPPEVSQTFDNGLGIENNNTLGPLEKLNCYVPIYPQYQQQFFRAQNMIPNQNFHSFCPQQRPRAPCSGHTYVTDYFSSDGTAARIHEPYQNNLYYPITETSILDYGPAPYQSMSNNSQYVVHMPEINPTIQQIEDNQRFKEINNNSSLHLIEDNSNNPKSDWIFKQKPEESSPKVRISLAPKDTMGDLLGTAGSRLTDSTVNNDTNCDVNFDNAVSITTNENSVPIQKSTTITDPEQLLQNPIIISINGIVTGQLSGEIFEQILQDVASAGSVQVSVDVKPKNNANNVKKPL